MGCPHCRSRDLRGVAAELLDRAERRRATEVQSLERARSSLAALTQRVEQQRIAELQSLEKSTDAYVRFQPASWDRFELQATGTGWLPSKSLILFEVCCQEDPLSTKLSLYLGPGSDEAVRERLFERANRHPHLLSASGRLKTWNQLLREPVALLAEDDLGLAWDDGGTTERIQSRSSRFFEERFPAIDEIVTECFRDETSL